MSWGAAIALLVAQEATPTPAPAPTPAPTVEAETPAPTRATFVSTTSEPWDVLVDHQPVCSTPCSGPLFPFQFVVLQSQDARPVLVEVGRLPPGDLVVQ